METIVLLVLAVVMIVVACLWVCSKLDASYGLDLVVAAKDSHKYDEALKYYRQAIKNANFWRNILWLIVGILIVVLGAISK